MQTKSNSKRNKIIAISAIAIFIIAIIVASIFSVATRDKKDSANIANFNSCVDGINDDIKDNIDKQLYDYIKATNDYNHKKSLDKYASNFRENSCKTEKNASSNGTFTTTAIIDVPDAKQSWKVNFSWTNNSAQNYVSIGSIKNQQGGFDTRSVSCPTKNELKFGDFNCEKALTYMIAQSKLAACQPEGNKPGYDGWTNIQTDGKFSFAKNDIARTSTKLSAIIEPQNASQTDANNKIACISVIPTNSAQTVNPNVNVTTKFQVQFITTGGETTTHEIIYTVDMDYNITVALDGKQI